MATIEGNLGLLNAAASPQGALHIHDGTGGLLFVTKTAIDGTAQVIVPNGTGDVTARLFIISWIMSNAGGSVAVSSSTGLVPGGTTDQSPGASTYQLRVNADGSVDIRRTAGTQAGTAMLILAWL